ncbi:MAG: DUF3152 domain-containing protein [Aeromicrobium sp.]
MTKSGRHRRDRSWAWRKRGAASTLVGGAAVVAISASMLGTEGVAAPPAPPSALEGATLTEIPTTVPRPSPATIKAAPVIPQRGEGSFVIVQSTSPLHGSGQRIDYRVEVERGVPISPASFAKHVDQTLADRRGWTKAGQWSFQRRPDATRRIVLASPDTVDRLCAPLRTNGEVSCRNGDVVVINAVRWTKGASAYDDDLAAYRTYVVNHEVGHSLGLTHTPCPGPGLRAPVMLQQTLGLDGCEKNPWP